MDIAVCERMKFKRQIFHFFLGLNLEPWILFLIQTSWTMIFLSWSILSVIGCFRYLAQNYMLRFWKNRGTILVHFLGSSHWKYRGTLERHHGMANEYNVLLYCWTNCNRVPTCYDSLEIWSLYKVSFFIFWENLKREKLEKSNEEMLGLSVFGESLFLGFINICKHLR